MLWYTCGVQPRVRWITSMKDGSAGPSRPDQIAHKVSTWWQSPTRHTMVNRGWYVEPEKLKVSEDVVGVMCKCTHNTVL